MESLESLATQLFIQQLAQANNIQMSNLCITGLWWEESTINLWILLTKGQ